MRSALLLLLLAAFLAPTSSPAQAGASGTANEVLTDFDGIPWGAPRADVERRYGAPSRLEANGDSVLVLRYADRTVLGRRAEMFFTFRQGELDAGGYEIGETPGTCLSTFHDVADQIARERPGLRRFEYRASFTRTPRRAESEELGCEMFMADSLGGNVYASGSLRDSSGPGEVRLIHMGSKRAGTTTLILYVSRERTQPRRSGSVPSVPRAGGAPGGRR